MSRWDSHGLMWQDQPRTTRERVDRPMWKPPVPEHCFNWRPADPPNLAAAKLLSIDIETYDPDLKEKGPGPRRDGYMVGIAVATEDAAWYLPMEHERQYDPQGVNLPRELVLRWAKRELTRPGVPKLFTNSMYDLDFLWQAGIEVPGPYDDVQVAEPLIDENARQYGLGSLAKKYLGEGKPEDELYEWLAAAYGGPATRSAQAGRIALAPPQLVAGYAMGDVRLPIQIFQHQQQVMRDEGLAGIYDIERRLIPLLLAMRRRGVRVDVAATRAADERLTSEAHRLRAMLKGEGVDAWASETIAAYCARKGVEHRVTAQGNPSFPRPWLENHHDPVIRAVAEVRRLEKNAGTFLEGAILGCQVNGRIHTQFHQLRGDEYGTVSGRLSSSNPNLQNIPARDEEMGPLVRSMFIPEPGELWASDDWSQIEFRLLVHYGGGPVAAAVRQQFRDDPATDFHNYVAELTGIERRPAKSINFGLVYGMGEPAMAANLGRDLEEVAPMFDQYHERLPFIRRLYNKANQQALVEGRITTILGRQRRWNLWAPKYGVPKDVAALPRQEAEAKWPNQRLRRYYTHKALNALLQGGAADIMKKAMVDIWEAGICDELGAPLLTVHDELNWSVPQRPSAMQAHQESRRIMETCVPLRLPLRVSTGTGINWAEAK